MYISVNIYEFKIHIHATLYKTISGHRNLDKLKMKRLRLPTFIGNLAARVTRYLSQNNTSGSIMDGNIMAICTDCSDRFDATKLMTN
jgi:hypothetical protein